MKKFATTLSVLAVTVASMMATVKAEVKIASVNMQELQVMFYKRVDAEERLKKQVAEVEEDVSKRREKVKALEQQLVDLQKQLDPTLSEQATKKIREKMVSIKNEFDAERQEFETFVKRRQLALSAIEQRELSLILQEMREAIREVAESEGIDVVLDSSPRTQLMLPYIKPIMNITEKVASKLNADAPAGYDAQEELKKVRGTSEDADGAAPTGEPPAASAPGDAPAAPAAQGGAPATPEIAQ